MIQYYFIRGDNEEGQEIHVIGYNYVSKRHWRVEIDKFVEC